MYQDEHQFTSKNEIETQIKNPYEDLLSEFRRDRRELDQTTSEFLDGFGTHIRVKEFEKARDFKQNDFLEELNELLDVIDETLEYASTHINQLPKLEQPSALITAFFENLGKHLGLSTTETLNDEINVEQIFKITEACKPIIGVLKPIIDIYKENRDNNILKLAQVVDFSGQLNKIFKRVDLLVKVYEGIQGQEEIKQLFGDIGKHIEGEVSDAGKKAGLATTVAGASSILIGAGYFFPVLGQSVNEIIGKVTASGLEHLPDVVNKYLPQATPVGIAALLGLAAITSPFVIAGKIKKHRQSKTEILSADQETENALDEYLTTVGYFKNEDLKKLKKYVLQADKFGDLIKELADQLKDDGKPDAVITADPFDQPGKQH